MFNSTLVNKMADYVMSLETHVLAFLAIFKHKIRCTYIKTIILSLKLAIYIFHINISYLQQQFQIDISKFKTILYSPAVSHLK